MKNTYGGQQGDTWLRNRVGRITGSRIVDVCSYLSRSSGEKKPGDSSGKRDNYRWELIGERLTGRAKNHADTPEMQWGRDNEEAAALYYESVIRQMVQPVNFVLHPKYDFTGCSPDRLVGNEGLLEIKCPETTTHLQYRDRKIIPAEYMPQTAWELACTERKWADFVSFDPRITEPHMRFFYRRVGRDELEFTIGSGKDERRLTGEAVIDYFTSEVLKLNAQIEFYFAENQAQPIAPFPVKVLEEDGPVEEISEDQARESAADYIDQFQVAP